MIKFFGWILLSCAIALSINMISPSLAQQSLYVSYPPNNHQTTAARIFLIGTAPTDGEVLVNGQVIERSKAGHFAPSFKLQLGENVFTLHYQNQTLQIKVIRQPTEPILPEGLAFGFLTPNIDITRMVGELICFTAVAPINSNVSVIVGDQLINLQPSQPVQLLPKTAVLIGQNSVNAYNNGYYQGCAKAEEIGEIIPQFQLIMNGKTINQLGQGKISILSPANLEVAEVIVEEGTARSGPSTDHSRLTPLPKGTKATITGREGEWLRLDYGGWIKVSEVQVIKDAVPPKSVIYSITYREVEGAIEIIFPLEVPIPVNVQQGDNTFILTLYNTTAKTDIIRFDDHPIISRLDWQQIAPETIQYTFNLKTNQQWGYRLRYEENSLILSLRYPPIEMSLQQGSLLYGNNIITGVVLPATPSKLLLSGIKILLDAGHGGTETGARGPTGYPEKDVNLKVAKLLQKQLEAKGATVSMTREDDVEVSLPNRVKMINEGENAIALSIHYNALPDDGDAMNTQGIGTFWYHPQAHSLAVFLHNYLVQELGRPSYGVYWDNLALTRPYSTPTVLLELGFMSNPNEFEWVTNPEEQEKLAQAIANGVVLWFTTIN